MNSETLIGTKFQRPAIGPAIGPDIIPRPHLIERLENGRYRKLTLISAPVGYGKSVLVSTWQEECSCLGAWLSLDKNDNDLAVFLGYFIGAIQTIFPNSFPETRDVLGGMQLPPLDTLVTILINEAASLPQPFILVLDDFHLIVNQEINQFLDSLIRYLPTHMHLVLVTRQDPALDLVNLRAKNQVSEIRMAELRFSKEEGQQYLERNLGDNVAPDLKHILIQRTEGWAAGLRLAVLALHGQTDQDHFLETFQGTNQHVMSYLVGEVLSQQPHTVKTFLLQTSLLDRFCAPLCEALMDVEDPGQNNGSKEILDRLLQDNLFLIPLDLKGKWFRYHHLFQDLLNHQLQAVSSAKEVSQLHVRASAWLADQGFIEEALDHAFRANDMDRAAQIVAQKRYGLMNEARWQLLERLLRHFPQDIRDQYPHLLMAETWIFYRNSQYTKLPGALRRLEQVINHMVMTREEKNHLLGEMNALRSLISYFATDVSSAIMQAEQSLRLTAPELWIVRVMARMLSAGAKQINGDLNGAYAAIYRSFDDEAAHSNALKATVLVTACNIDWMAANLHDLQLKAMQVVNLSQNARSPEMLGFGHYHLGTVAYHQNDLSAATEHFRFVDRRPYRNYGDSYAYSACGLALTYQAIGQELGARDVVNDAQAFLLVTGNAQLLSIMKSFQAELSLRQGQLGFASQWASQLDPAMPLSPMFRIYAPHMTLVRVWLAEGTTTSRSKAASLLDQLRQFLERTHNTIYLIEALALQAVLHQSEGDETEAMAALEQALILALPGNIIRLFVDQGPIIGDLLSRLALQDTELAAYKDRILAAVSSKNTTVPLTGQPDSALRDDNGAQPPSEPLTNREMDVLLLLSQRQTDKEIAATLVISPYTVRTHTRNIYGKLSVNNRRQAAIRAAELGLLDK